MTTIVPPIKSQGIKTKLVPWINDIICRSGLDLVHTNWIEPFFGTGVVGLNAPIGGNRYVADSNFSSDNEEFVLFQGDSMSILPNIGQQVDMIFADPPYFLSKNMSRCINGTWKSFEKGEWDRTTTFDKINDFNKSWLLEC